MRLIDADKLVKTFCSHCVDHDECKSECMDLKIIKSMKTVDAERHGHWVSDRLCSTNGGTYGVRRCSNCEYYCNDYGDEWNYCPHCGAKMDEV